MSCSRDIGVQKQSNIEGFFSDVAYLRNKSWLNLPKLSETFSEPLKHLRWSFSQDTQS